MSAQYSWVELVQFLPSSLILLFYSWTMWIPSLFWVWWNFPFPNPCFFVKASLNTVLNRRILTCWVYLFVCLFSGKGENVTHTHTASTSPKLISPTLWCHVWNFSIREDSLFSLGFFHLELHIKIQMALRRVLLSVNNTWSAVGGTGKNAHGDKTPSMKH